MTDDLNELSAEITRLSEIWYALVNLDHHKDRDCHWQIETTWSYGDGPKFTVYHEGYVHERVNRRYPTLRRAMVGLRDEIQGAIDGIRKWAREALEHPDDYDWSHAEAKSALAILKEYDDTGA